MSDGRRKKSVNGGAPAQTILDDRRSSLPEVEASPPAGKRAVIKSADMKDDMQKEAIEIALSVSLSYSLFVVYPILLCTFFGCRDLLS